MVEQRETAVSGHYPARVLVYTHRWLGIVAGLLFIVWFLSGIVMMYARLPALDPLERLARLPAIAPASIRVAPPLDAAMMTSAIPPAKLPVIQQVGVIPVESEGENLTAGRDAIDSAFADDIRDSSGEGSHRGNCSGPMARRRRCCG